tara:strand:- start:26446 stop:26913 length:468 start_codon:yes stop_codon:yes gene_type:complete
MFQNYRFHFVMCTLMLGLTGCGGAAATETLPTTVPVAGVVTLDGKPLVSATVTFVPRGATKGVECVGFTDESGKYTLTQIRGAEGAPPGEYRVVINHFVKSDGTPVKIDGGEAPANVGADEALPAIYSDFTNSILSAQVTEAGGEFPFELKIKGK